MLSANWLCQDSLNTPSHRDARLKRAALDAKFDRPFGYRKSLVVKSHAKRASAVALLSGGIGPAHIAGEVPTIIVDTVNTEVLPGASANVGEKCWVIISPLVTDSNTSPAVISPMTVTGIQAPSFDHGPNAVFGRYMADPRVAVTAATTILVRHREPILSVVVTPDVYASQGHFACLILPSTDIEMGCF